MYFLANENFPKASINLLRQAGHDVVSIMESFPGAKDQEVLSRASLENRIVLTFDRDYGELIYLHKQVIPVGVIYFRFYPVTPEEPAEYLLKLLQMKGLSLEGKFTVMERSEFRQRPLP